MLMLSCRFRLVVVMLFGEMMLFYQPQLFEELQVSVDCGQANPRVLLLCPTIQFIGIEMGITLAKKIEEQGALNCHPLARASQYLLGAPLLLNSANHILAPTLLVGPGPSCSPQSWPTVSCENANANHLHTTL